MPPLTLRSAFASALLSGAVLGAQTPAPTTWPQGLEDAAPSVVRVRVDPGAPQGWIDGLGKRLGAPPPPSASRLLGSLGVSAHPAGATPEGDAPGGLCFTPDGAQVLIAHWESHDVIVWDVSSGAFVRAIPVSGSPLDVAVTPDGLHAVTANGFEDTASILDLTLGTESAVIPLGDQPSVVVISPDGTRAAIGNTAGVGPNGEGTLSIVDVAGALELRRVPGLSYSMLLTINFENGSVSPHFAPFAFAGNGTVVLADFRADRVALVDVATGAVAGVAVPAGPDGLAVSASGTTAVATCGTGQALAVVDLSSRTLTKTIALADYSFGGAVALNPAATKAAVGVLNAVRVVDLVTSAVGPALPGSADEIHTTADGLYAFCVGFNGGLLSWSSGALVKNLDGVVPLGTGAVSPVAARAVGVGAVFGEDLLIFDTNGASGSLLHRQLSGPGPEGDRARLMALSRDGTRVAVTHNASDSLEIQDAASGALLRHVAVGERPAEVEFTPDGALAVVANLDSPFASVVDVASGVHTPVTISTRAHQVELSPDGRYAYLVTAVADGVWRVDLVTKSVAGPKLATGDTGSIGFLYQQTSGMTLSHDGRTLAVCGSFSNTLTLIDTTSWSVAANVPLAGFPVRAIFDATDENVLVSARDADAVRVVRNLGPSSSVVASYATGDQPYELALSLDSARLYVANFGVSTVRVLRTSNGSTLRNIPYPDALGGMALSADGARLCLATGNWSVSFGPGPLFSRASTGQFTVVNTHSWALEAQAATGFAPGMLALDSLANTAVFPSTFVDGYAHVVLPPRRGPRAF